MVGAKKIILWSLAVLILLFVVFIALFFHKDVEVYPADNDTQVYNQTEQTYCTPEQRLADACFEIYQPVCGWFISEIQCIKYPCAATYTNSCFACQDGKVEYWTMGACPE